MKKLKGLVFGVIFFLVLTKGAFSYDKDLADKFDAFFSKLTPEFIAKRPCMITVKDLFDMIQKKEPFIILDIRTPQERNVVKINLPNTLEIPMHEVFKPENLAKLPKDKKIIVICHTATRSVAVSLPLNMLGFQALVLDGGISELTKAAGRGVVGIAW